MKMTDENTLIPLILEYLNTFNISYSKKKKKKKNLTKMTGTACAKKKN